MPTPILGTYSGKDLNISYQSPFGQFTAAGVAASGVVKAMVRMSTVRTNLKVGMDGSVAPSFIPGDNGEIEIQVFQTSPLHQLLTSIMNGILTAANAGDVSNAYAGTVLMQNIVDGSSHTATGVCPQKFPDKSYDTEAQAVTWILTAANIVNA